MPTTEETAVIAKIAAQAAAEIVERAASAATALTNTATAAASALAATTSSDLSYIKKDIADIKDKLDNKYVTKEEFSGIRNFVYGLIGIICVSVVGAVLALVLKK